VLNTDHYGLEKIKERILEFLAVRQLVKNPKGSILCFAGPPAWARLRWACPSPRPRAANLSGLVGRRARRGRDSRHRRTYIGALPGQIIQHMKRAGTRNPVFCSTKWTRWPPTSAATPPRRCLRCLTQSRTLPSRTHYLDVDYEPVAGAVCSHGHVLHTVPAALQDRMEVLRCKATPSRKAGNRAPIPGQEAARADRPERKERYLADDAISRSSATTPRGGRRNLEREIGNVCRKVAARWSKAAQSTRKS